MAEFLSTPATIKLVCFYSGGFGIKKKIADIFQPSFSPGRAAAGINSIPAEEAEARAAFKSQTGQRSHILSAPQRLLANC